MILRFLQFVCIAIISYLAFVILELHGNRNSDKFALVARIPYNALQSHDTHVDALIYQSMKEYGFFFVTNVTDYNATVELDYLKRFFSLPDRVKMMLAVNKHNSDNRNVYRGYGPLQSDTGTQYKELFNIGPYEDEVYVNLTDALSDIRSISVEKNVWPTSDDPQFDAEFKRVFKRGFNLRRNVALLILESISRHLNHPELIDRFTHHEFSTLGLRQYPIRKTINKNMYSSFDSMPLMEMEHEDSTVTVLSTFSNAGLQALNDGEYLDVPCTGDTSFMINVGTLISDITDNRVLAVNHRVKQTNRVRHSIPFFLNPSFDADISLSLNGRRTTVGDKYKIFGEWMKDYLPKVEPALLRSKLAPGDTTLDVPNGEDDTSHDLPNSKMPLKTHDGLLQL